MHVWYRRPESPVGPKASLGVRGDAIDNCLNLSETNLRLENWRAFSYHMRCPMNKTPRYYKSRLDQLSQTGPPGLGALPAAGLPVGT